jgi:type I restriction-modification system DNA methylase subunit
MSAIKRKRTGAHFTPPGVGTLVAERLAALLKEIEGSIRILDPACGDGNLLQAMADVLSKGDRQRVTLIGIENDPASFSALRSRRPLFRECQSELIHADFLDFFSNDGLFDECRSMEPVDVIIANPPYVRIMTWHFRTN